MKLVVTGLALSAAAAAVVSLAPAAQALPPGRFVGVYQSETACAAAGDYGVAHGQWTDYTCTLVYVQPPQRSLWVQ